MTNKAGKDVIIDEPEPLMTSVLGFFAALLCGVVVNATVYIFQGPDDALLWFNGWVLEWALSIDNLFVFYVVFNQYRTPHCQRRAALFYGILGAIVFRLIFFIAGGWLIRSVSWVKYILGAFLIYTGYKAAFMDEEEDDDEAIESQFMVRALSFILPVYPDFMKNKSFFVRERDAPRLRLHTKINREELETPAETEAIHRTEEGVNPEADRDRQGNRGKLMFTMLAVVVASLEGVDLVFALDSTSAILASIPDVFLAYSATLMALFGLRSAYFITDRLIGYFSLMKFALALLLGLIGCRLLLNNFFIIPDHWMTAIMISLLSLSVVGSVIQQKFFPENVNEDAENVDSNNSSQNFSHVSNAITSGIHKSNDSHPHIRHVPLNQKMDDEDLVHDPFTDMLTSTPNRGAYKDEDDDNVYDSKQAINVLQQKDKLHFEGDSPGKVEMERMRTPQVIGNPALLRAADSESNKPSTLSEDSIFTNRQE